MTCKFTSGLLTIILLSSQHISAMEFPFPTPEQAESVEWHDDIQENQTTAPRDQSSNWRLPRISRGQAQLLTLTLLASGAAADAMCPYGTRLVTPRMWKQVFVECDKECGLESFSFSEQCISPIYYRCLNECSEIVVEWIRQCAVR